MKARPFEKPFRFETQTIDPSALKRRDLLASSSEIPRKQKVTLPNLGSPDEKPKDRFFDITQTQNTNATKKTSKVTSTDQSPKAQDAREIRSRSPSRVDDLQLSRTHFSNKSTHTNITTQRRAANASVPGASRAADTAELTAHLKNLGLQKTDFLKHGGPYDKPP